MSEPRREAMWQRERREAQEAETTADSKSAGLGPTEAGPFSREALLSILDEKEAWKRGFFEAKGKVDGVKSALKEEVCELKKEVKTVNDKLDAALKGAAAAEWLKEERERVTLKSKQYEKQLEETQAKVGVLEQQLEAAKQGNQNVEELQKEREGLVAKLREVEESARRQQLASSKELTDLREQVKAAGKESANEAERLKQRLETANVKVDALKKEIEERKEGAGRLERRLAAANAEIERLYIQRVTADEERKATVEGLEQQLVAADAVIKEVKEKLRISQNGAEETVQSDLGHIQLGEAQAQVSTLQHDLEAAKRQGNQNVEELVEEKRELLAKVRTREDRMKEAEILRWRLATTISEVDVLKKRIEKGTILRLQRQGSGD